MFTKIENAKDLYLIILLYLVRLLAVLVFTILLVSTFITGIPFIGALTVIIFSLFNSPLIIITSMYATFTIVELVYIFLYKKSYNITASIIFSLFYLFVIYMTYNYISDFACHGRCI